MDSPLQLLSISGAVIPGDEGVDAAADTDENTGKQRYGGGGGADGRHGQRAGKPADDGDIRHIKQNLKHVGGHQRQTEQQNLPGKPLRRAGGDFGFHGILLLGQAFITVFPQTVFFGGKAEPL